jgi:hypothetical protein
MLQSSAEPPSTGGKEILMKFWTVFLALVLALGAMDADAARRWGLST